jgi:glycosyltransferase involved in cell wall biosynthesis
MAALVEGDGDPLLRVVARAFPRSRCWSAAPPSALAACGEDVLVSVVTPTTPGRRWTHRSLYRCFAQQTWPWKELVVLETGGAPSPFWEATARNDGRVRYAHDENDAALGAKRRRLAEAARGDVVAHFDDDDLYGPAYVDGLVATLLEGGRDGAAKAEEPRVATLVSWLSLDVETGRVAAYDVDDDRRAVEAALGGAVGDRAAAERLCARSLGYGFSFAYTKAAAALAPFDDAVSRQRSGRRPRPRRARSSRSSSSSRRPRRPRATTPGRTARRRTGTRAISRSRRRRRRCSRRPSRP